MDTVLARFLLTNILGEVKVVRPQKINLKIKNIIYLKHNVVYLHIKCLICQEIMNIIEFIDNDLE